MAIYRIDKTVARHKPVTAMKRGAAMVLALSVLANCSTVISMPTRSGSGFFASSDVESTGSIPETISSQTLPVLLGDSRWPAAKGALSIALKQSSDGDTVSWNDDGAGGSVTPTASFTDKNDQECRRLSIVDNESDAGELIFDACKTADGDWTVEPSST